MKHSQNTQLTPKYRPSLTLEQLNHIVSLAKTEQPAISTTSITLLGALVPFIAKIECKTKAPAYSLAPPAPSTLESLGAPAPTPALESIPAGLAVSKEEYWEACYTKHLATPSTCTLEEILAAKEHKYLNDLMEPAELAEFEASLLDSM